MALEKAGINLTIQGEAQYIAGLRNVNREMDLMATNTKLAVAQLGQGASPTQKFNTQMRSLGAEIQKASTQTMILRNRNKELPNEIFKTGKSLDGLKDDYEKQVKVLESYRQKRDEVYKDNSFYSEDSTKAREAFNEQQASVKELESEIKKLEGSYNGMLEEYERMPNSMAEAQLATQQLLNEQAKLRDEYLKSGGVFAGFADKLESSGEKLQKYGRNISDIGDAFMGVTVGILAGGGGALKAFMDWEAALRGAMKTNSEIIDSNGNVTYSYQDLEDGLRGLSKEIPVANTELAEFAEIAGRLQVPTDEVVGFTEVVAKLGETTNLTGEEAAEQLGKFINITGASTSSTLNLANALVELGNNSASSEQEALRMSTRWASTGKIIGMSDDQILALSASVISLGIRTEAAGSAVQRSFLKINDAVLEGGDTLASFAKTAGMSSEDFKKAWQDDAAHALIPFLKGLNDTHEAGGNVNGILKDLGITSVNELNTLLVLAGGYDQLAGNLELASNAYNETEESMMALNKEAELAYGTTLGKLRTAWNRLKDSLIDIGEPIADAVLDMVDAAEPLFKTVEDLATGFSNLDETAQRDIISTVAKIALIAPALKIAGGAMTTLGDIFKVGAGVTRIAGKVITKAMFGIAGETATLTTVAGTAAGSQGVGGLITSLAGSAGLPWALGIAAVALGGWTLWKTWGEDAWNAAVRTKRWGTAVSESVGEALGSVSDHSQTATGMFTLMQQGVKTDSTAMIDDFESMGRVIENSLVTRISALDELIEGLPSTLENTLGKIMSEDKEAAEESLEEIKKHNERISEIRSAAAKDNRNITILEAKQIQDLTKASAAEYVKTLGLTKDEQQEMLHAMTGDVENASAEQATQMAKSLGKQRQVLVGDRAEKRKLYKEGLEETGFYGEARIDELMAMWDQGNQTITNGIDEQLRLIAEKYPHIADEVLFANGQMIDSNADYASTVVAENRKIIDAAYEMSATLEYRAAQNAERMQWMGDEATEMGRVWNGLILDEHGMLVESNAREAVIEASANIDTWNSHIRPQLKRADLHSNAKLIIGEAAIANGLWDGMAYEDKMAVLEDNFSPTLYEALEGTEIWNKLIAERKYAVLRNEFGHTLTQALIDFGTWDDLDPLIQEAVLTTNTPETLQQVLEDIGEWDKLDPVIQDLIADSQPVKDATGEAERMLDEYGNIIVGRPVMGVTDNVTSEITRLQQRINQLQGRNVYINAIARAGGSASSRRFIESGGRILHARGTDFHPGGMAMVNDQNGATFRELVTLPDGSSFVPKGRNVLLDLPKGSRVLRAALTKMKFPDIKQYKDGVGYSRQQTQQIMANNNTDMSQTNNLLTTLIDMVRNGQVIQMDGNEVGRTVYSTIDGTMTRNIQRNQIMNMQGG